MTNRVHSPLGHGCHHILVITSPLGRSPRQRRVGLPLTASWYTLFRCGRTETLIAREAPLRTPTRKRVPCVRPSRREGEREKIDII